MSKLAPKTEEKLTGSPSGWNELLEQHGGGNLVSNNGSAC